MNAPVSPPPVPTITLGFGGVLGEPAILSILTGVPEDQIRTVTLKGVGLRMQKLEEIKQEAVREDLKAGWDERGVPFFGAFMLTAVPDEEAQVRLVTIPISDFPKIKRRIHGWNYHSKEDKQFPEPWMRFYMVDGVDEEGNAIRFMADAAENAIDFSPPPENYKDDPAYPKFEETMGIGLTNYIQTVEPRVEAAAEERTQLRLHRRQEREGKTQEIGKQ